jgi:hypothetical protein
LWRAPPTVATALKARKAQHRRDASCVSDGLRLLISNLFDKIVTPIARGFAPSPAPKSMRFFMLGSTLQRISKDSERCLQTLLGKPGMLP